MILTYWTPDPHNGDAGREPESMQAWRELFPNIQMYSRADVASMLEEFGADSVALFNRILIPACQSDLARLLLIYRIGGLYVDAHTGPGGKVGLIDIFDKLSAYELVVFEKPWERVNEQDLHLINTVIAGRRRSPAVAQLVRSALENLRRHEQAEADSEGYVAYNIFILTGAWDIRSNLMTTSEERLRLKNEFEDSVCLYPLRNDKEDGLQLYRYYSYRKPGRHWSERQTSERLFAPRNCAGEERADG